jgi:hypothetical protein
MSIHTKQIIFILSKIIHNIIKNYKYLRHRYRVKYQTPIRDFNLFKDTFYMTARETQHLEIAVRNTFRLYTLVRNLQLFALDTKYTIAHCKILTID